MASTQTVSPWAHGIAVFAGVIMVVGGAFQALESLAGIIAEVISAIMNFVWIPIAPWWALMVIAVDVLIIWALASYLRQPAPQKTPAATS